MMILAFLAVIVLGGTCMAAGYVVGRGDRNNRVVGEPDHPEGGG